jgi:flagellin
MRAQIRGLDQASRNAQDGISLIQTAEGALSGSTELLQRMRELAIQASNGIYEESDAKSLDLEFQQLKEELDKISVTTKFNGLPLLDGTFSRSFEIITPDIIIPDTIIPGQTETIFGHSAKSSLFNNTDMQTQLQNAVLDVGSFIQVNIMLNDGETRLARVDMARAVLEHDSNFEDFLHNTLYESDGSITEENLAHFAETLQGGMRFMLAAHEDALGVDFGSQYFVVGFDVDGRLHIGYPDDNFVLQNIQMHSIATPGENNFGRGFFLDMFATTAFDRASSITYNVTPDVIIPGGIIPGVKVSHGRPLHLQVGANAGNSMEISIDSMTVRSLGLEDSGLTPWERAMRAIAEVFDAISTVVSQRGSLGAYQNRLEHIINALHVYGENMSAAESRIRDADMAKEMMELIKVNILQQASTAMLAQAYQLPQNVLQLLQK